MLIEFCLPAHNEEKIIKNNILKLLNYCDKKKFDFDWRIVVINNGSTDNSEKICREQKFLFHTKKKFKIENIKIAGKGNAIKKYCLKSDADIIVYMDIDLAVSLNNIPRLIDCILKNNFDLAIGSRLLANSKTERKFSRSITSKAYNILSKIILRHNISDLQCGFKAIKTNKLKSLIPYLKNNKWFFDTELIMFAKKFNYKIKEIPVEWKESRYDTRKSKINIIRDSSSFFINLIKLKFKLSKLEK